MRTPRAFTRRLRRACFGLLLVGASSIGAPAAARSVEAGSAAVGILAGPSFALQSALGTASAFGSLGLQAEYIFDPVISALFDLTGSFSTTTDLRLHIGPRWRLPHTGLPLVPFVQAQVALGRLFGVVGADLQFIGGRVGLGAEYYLLQDLSIGALAACDVGSTAGERPAFYGVAELLFNVAWTFSAL